MDEWVNLEDLGKYKRREKAKGILGQIKRGLTPSESVKKKGAKVGAWLLDAADRAAKAQEKKPVLKKAPKKRASDFMLPTQDELDKLWR
jgi:hypothetical protein